MALARLDLVRHRIAVTRRATFQDVRHIDVRAGQADSRQQLVEQLAGRADEGNTLLVLVEARRLADEHEIGALIARAEHHLRATRCKRTAGAASYLVAI